MPDNDNYHALSYPPLPADELRDAHGYDNIVRVVVTQNGVWGLSNGGGWVRFHPLATLPGSKPAR